MDIKLQIGELLKIAQSAGDIIMKHYNAGPVKIQHKQDSSPVTQADIESSDYIIAQLRKLYPAIAVVSEEESSSENLAIIQREKRYWLIDPIDGTWSFIKKRGCFTVNIALIEHGVPVWGVIYSPLHGDTYYCAQGKAFKIDAKGVEKEISAKKIAKDGYDFLISSNNLTQSAADFIDQYAVRSMTPIPSSIKFCLLAEGKGDIYPRFLDTSIWDTGAGHAILLAIGGAIVDMEGNELRYDGDSLLNPNFIAVSSRNHLLFDK